MNRQLQFVHIGKCGGSTIHKLLFQSSIVNQKYSSFFESHINGVDVSSSCDYLICLRNPIQRAFSAFEWRKKLILDDVCPDQSIRFPGERKVLKKYGSLNTLASSLYRPDGKIEQSASRDFKMIHHLRESISFYLTPLLSVLSPNNIFGVICQETLSADCERLLGVDASNSFERRNFHKRSICEHLDDVAVFNLRRFLSEDYQCISALWSLGVIRDKQLARLVFDTEEL